MSVNLSLDIKQGIALLKQGPEKISNKDIGAKFNVSKSTVGRVLKEFKNGEFVLGETIDVTPPVEDKPVVLDISDEAVYVLWYMRDANILPAYGDDIPVAAVGMPGLARLFCEKDELDLTGTKIGSERILQILPELSVFNHDYKLNAGLSKVLVTAELIDIINRALDSVKVNGGIPARDAVNAVIGKADLAKLHPNLSKSTFSRAHKSVPARLCSFIRGALDGEVIEEEVAAVTEIANAVEEKEACPSERELLDAIGDGNAPYPVAVHANSVVIVANGQPKTVDPSHQNFVGVCKAIVAKAWQKALDLCDVTANVVEAFKDENIEVSKGTLFLDGVKVDGRLSSRIIEAVTSGKMDDFTQRLIKFLRKIDENPSNQIVTRIYDFMRFNDIEIDEDGDILAYKVVDPRFLDLRTHTMDNSVGATVKVKRHQVDERMNQTCSYGLHVCAVGYIESYSGNPHKDKVIRIKMNPADVVAIPRDYGDAKVRCCKYVVLADVTDDYLRGKIIHEVRDYNGNLV